MYKAMHQSMRDSEKLANLSDFAFRVWEMGCVASDLTGRITANPKKFWAQAMPLVNFDEAKYAAAIAELKGLVHFYEVDGKKFMVFHDHDEHNKGTKNLRNIRPSCPPPPPNLCFCVVYTKKEEGGVPAVPTADGTADSTAGVQDPVPVLVHVPLPEKNPEQFPDSPESRLVRLALKAKLIFASERQLRTHISGWLADKGFQYLESLLMNDAIRGKDVFWVHETYFKPQKNGKAPPGARRKVINPKCDKCHGKGRRPNPITGGEMDCGCVREVAV